MHFSYLTLATLLSAVSAQKLTDVLASSPDVSSLATLVGTFPDLLQVLGSAKDITILAPNNDALKALLSSPEGAELAKNTDAVQALLTYHVINGTFAAADIPTTPAFVPTLLTDTAYTNVTGGQVVKVVREGEAVTVTSGGGAESNVKTADVKFDGGVIHIIDKVLTVPGKISTTAVAAKLTALAGALTTAKLVDTVDGLVDATVFAPNDAAFEKISSALENISVEDLTNVLTYHVVQGTVGYSSVLKNGQKIETVQKGSVTVTIDGEGNIFVNDAQVIVADVLVANGVVHVINAVLNPEAADATPTATATIPSSTGNAPVGGNNGTTPTGPSSPPAVATTNAAVGLPAAVGAAALFGGVAAMMNL